MGTTLLEVFAPIADSIVERVTARVLQAFERYTPPLYAPDKALSQKETADMLMDYSQASGHEM